MEENKEEKNQTYRNGKERRKESKREAKNVRDRKKKSGYSKKIF